MIMAVKKGCDYHTAIYNNKQHTATAQGWSKILDTHHSAVNGGLRRHYSMQAFIDEEFAEKQKQFSLFRTFCFSGVGHAVI
jgi:hypothetical protein